MKRLYTLAVVLLALAVPASAQQSQGTGSDTATAGQGQVRTTVPVVLQQRGRGVLLTNVRLELTITDQSGAGQPSKKMITLLLAELGSGRVRSSGMVYRTPTVEIPHGAYEVTLNADAIIHAIEGEKVRTSVTVEYAPAAAQGTASGPRGSPLNQTVEVVLSNGKPTVIVQAADPLSDRKVTLEATATIVR